MTSIRRGWGSKAWASFVGVGLLLVFVSRDCCCSSCCRPFKSSTILRILRRTDLIHADADTAAADLPLTVDLQIEEVA